MTTVIVFFHTVTTVANETDLWQAGKYPPPTMPVQNARQLTGEKILKPPKTAMTDTYTLSAHSPIPTDRGKEKQKSKRKNQRKVKDKEKL